MRRTTPNWFPRLPERNFNMARRADYKTVAKLLAYNPLTGQITRLTSVGGQQVGSLAGWVDGDGYRHVSINNRSYLASHVAFMLMEGRWPRSGLEMDHIDTNRANDRWKNLREVTTARNRENRRRVRKDSASQVKGVLAVGRRFKAQLSVKRQTLSLGTYDTADEAHLVHLVAKCFYHLGFYQP